MNYIDLLGKEFEWGGRGPEKFDCYGLCIELSRRLNINIPDSIWSEEPEEIDNIIENARHTGCIKVEKPNVGDLIGFMLRPPFISHIGFIVNTNPVEFLHITKGTRVSRERLDSLVWNKKFAGYYRWRE
jgi:cell wall-associated NlpC family hydrolase